jgi:hypothetical protein
MMVIHTSRRSSRGIPLDRRLRSGRKSLDRLVVRAVPREGAAAGGTGDGGTADHLIFVAEPHAGAVAARGAIATLLPSAAFFVRPRRFAHSMRSRWPVSVLGMALEEALVASPLNVAAAPDRADRVGSVGPGKQMEAAVVDGARLDLMCVGELRFGS